ncbi:MAG: hypothetical protein COU72_00970 [Parcubacteria group bacterium CG10_big_fil_rev_8_21_14_0_10_41_35]|nr:MAG: hypothetical protein COU72_00970 [Parcubacteria group bacterium CG10_big_fil_rev_8_21_14_0_10_41_35]
MKVMERNEAIKLRKQGMAMGEIAKKIGVSKSSVSYWVRDIAITKQQRSKLNANGHSVEAIEKRRIARLANTQKHRDIIKQEALIEASQLVSQPLWCIGVALYWGEGGKTQQTARISNADPTVIFTMMRFFREICEIPEEKFRGHVHTFAHTNINKSVQYWSTVSDIPTTRFYKTYCKPSSASRQKRDTLPYGTVQIYVHDSDFFFRLIAWIEYLKNNKL